MTAFQHIIGFEYRLLPDEIEVFVEFTHLYLRIAAGNIYLAIVEEHSRIVIDAAELFLFPFSFGITGCQQPAAGVVAVDEHIVLPFVVSH